jgi:hypothetical protein
MPQAMEAQGSPWPPEGGRERWAGGPGAPSPRSLRLQRRRPAAGAISWWLVAPQVVPSGGFLGVSFPGAAQVLPSCCQARGLPARTGPLLGVCWRWMYRHNIDEYRPTDFQLMVHITYTSQPRSKT